MLNLWVEFFEDLQQVRGRSRNTVMAYRRDLDLYEEFKNLNKPIGQIYEFLNKHKLSARSQARVISSIRTYLKFCETLGFGAPELRELKPPKVNAALPKAVDINDFKKLFEASIVEDPNKTIRNQITLLMLFGLGCRVTEMIEINLSDFNETDSWICVTGKGGKQRLIPVMDSLIIDLKKYLLEVRPTLVKSKTESILINDRGNRPSRIDIWRWLDAWSKKAGFTKTISPHKFRHGCATSLLEGGADLRSIQMLLGHSSIQTTQIYTNVSTRKIQKEIDEHHPLSGLES